MKFEYDPAKSVGNKAKHGIDFEEAKVLWHDEKHIVIDSAYKAEPRSLVIGSIDGVCWVAVVTCRLEHIRIISCRRARKYEEALYVQEDSN
jgi:uncharacterized DUF497 family protein